MSNATWVGWSVQSVAWSTMKFIRRQPRKNEMHPMMTVEPAEEYISQSTSNRKQSTKAVA